MVNPFKIWEYIINGTGPLTTTVAGDSIGFIKTNKSGTYIRMSTIKPKYVVLSNYYKYVMQIRK